MPMPGLNVQPARPQAPFQMLPPEVLAQLAAAGFRPPQGGGGPGLPGVVGGGAPGFNMADGLGLGMGMGAGMFNNTGGDGRTIPEGNISEFPAGGGPRGPSGGALTPTPPGMVLDPTNPSYGDLGGPGMTPQQSGGGFWDFLTGGRR